MPPDSQPADDRSPDPVDRRPVLKVLAGGAVVLTGAGIGARVFLHDGDAGRPAGDATAEGPGLSLSADGGSDIDTLYVGLGDDLLPATGTRRWQSKPLPTSIHSMVAFTWTDPVSGGGRGKGPKPHLLVRSRRQGRWGDWQRMPLLRDVPDPGTDEAGNVTGTDLVWIGRSSGIQVQLKGARPADLRLLLMQPAARDRDRMPEGRQVSRKRVGAVVVRPEILDRVAWGADESWRSGTPKFIATIEQVHVHHTVSTNTYLPEDVPALIRGMYRYHTKTLGWSDLAYNFLVDRFGRIWTGRAGGASKSVRGAHTLGFNATSCGVSVIGNLDQVGPTTETLDAIAAVAAWKLDLYGRDPLATATVMSEGSDRFRSGTAVTLPVIDGHRDTNDTSCPGGYLYAALPDIRLRAKARIDAAIAAAAAPVGVVTPTTVTGITQLDQTLSVVPGAYEPADAVPTYTWLRDGAPVATGPSYAVTAADVGHQLSVAVAATAPLRSTGTEAVLAGLPVTAQPVVTMKVTPKPKLKRLVVHVKVSAPDGLDLPVNGQVEVRLDNRKRLVDVVDGRGSTRFVKVKPGAHRLKATFPGAGPLSRRVAKRRITVS